MTKGLLGILVFVFCFSQRGMASPNIPDCMDDGRALPIDNNQILKWEDNTPNQFHARGHAEGIVSVVYSGNASHNHFAIQVGPADDDLIEIVYNVDFGKLPQMKPGMKVEACGDYITANAKSGAYPPSPVGALIHWVHKSDSAKHPSGFLVIDEVLYGVK